MLLTKLYPTASAILTDRETGAEAIVRHEDVPRGRGSSTTIRVGGAVVRYGPQDRDEHRQAPGSAPCRWAWFDAPGRVRIRVARLATPPADAPVAVAPARSLAEFRVRARRES